MKESPYHPGSGIPAGNLDKHPSLPADQRGPHHPVAPSPKTPKTPAPRRDLPKGTRP